MDTINLPNTRPQVVEGRHVNPEQMKVTLPAGYTPAYWLPDHVHGVTVASRQPRGWDNEWLLIGTRHELVTFADKVAHMHFTCANPTR